MLAELGARMTLTISIGGVTLVVTPNATPETPLLNSQGGFLVQGTNGHAPTRIREKNCS